MSARMQAVFDLPPPLPARIGKYLVLQRIGSGAMGIVYRATDPDIQRPVAIKTIRPRLLASGAEDLAAVRRFRLEAQAAGRLSHPNIVSVYEYGESPEGLYIAMECVEGRSLRELLGNGTRLAIEDVSAVMLQLLDALRCAHQQHVWHCDIKPANLLVTRDGHLKVGDFGIARLDGDDAGPRGAVIGSPGYMAPERYRGEAPDQRADLFACGVLLYELLTGVSPFCGDAPSAMAQVLHDEPPPASGLHGEAALVPLDAVVARAIAKDPDARYASAADMRAALVAATPPGSVRHAISPAALVHMRRSGTAGDAPSSPAPARAGYPHAHSYPHSYPHSHPHSHPHSPPQAPLHDRTLVLPRPALAAPTAPTAPAVQDPRRLAQLETLLRPLLGPMARLVVRDAARRHAGLPELIAHIADNALRPGERETFLRRAGRIASAAGMPLAGPRPSPAPTTPMPVLGETPLRPEDVSQAARVLAEEIGPLALLLARRAAATATSCEQFFCALVEKAEGVDRRALLTRLWQHRPPRADR